MITLRELLDKALLSVPETEESLDVNQLQRGRRFQHRGGVYVFYSQYHEPLYVGISNDVGKRVAEHIGSEKGNPDIRQYVESGKHLYCNVFYEDEKSHQEIYECYLIIVLNPRYNVGKTGRQKV